MVLWSLLLQWWWWLLLSGGVAGSETVGDVPAENEDWPHSAAVQHVLHPVPHRHIILVSGGPCR
jgi:hypothetical protein